MYELNKASPGTKSIKAVYLVNMRHIFNIDIVTCSGQGMRKCINQNSNKQV